MSTVEEVKAALAKLTLEERAEILAELCGWTDDDWDRQMKADAAAGKFTVLNRIDFSPQQQVGAIQARFVEVPRRPVSPHDPRDSTQPPRD